MAALKQLLSELLSSSGSVLFGDDDDVSMAVSWKVVSCLGRLDAVWG